MSKINDGGPAFPRHPGSIEHDNRQFDLNGMTLRDYFAGQAIAECAREGFFDSQKTEEKAIWYARVAYAMADAMIRERERQP